MFLRRLSPLITETLARRSEYWNNLAASPVLMRGSCGVAPGSTGGFCCAFKAKPWAVAIAPARAKKDLRETDMSSVTSSRSRSTCDLLHHAGRLFAYALHPPRIPAENIAGQAGDEDIPVAGQ